MAEKSTPNPIENRRLLRALAASIKSFEPAWARRIKENSEEKNTTLIIDMLTALEKKAGLHIDLYRLVAVAKRAIVSGDYAPYWDLNARIEGLRE